MKRTAFILFGWLCVVIGAIGVILPLLPTTPFMIVAAWAFARSSPRFQAWLETHPILGRYIQNWRRYGVIPLSAKVLAIAMMSASLTWLALFADAPAYVVAVVACAMAGVTVYLLRHPSVRPDDG